jgi:hypothetical protein
MSLGVGRIIGSNNLPEFALSRAFRVASANRNQRAAECKSCGEALSMGQGREVLVEGMKPGQFTRCFFCTSCFPQIKVANERYPTSEEGRPAWWDELDRERTDNRTPKQKMEDLLRDPRKD